MIDHAELRRLAKECIYEDEVVGRMWISPNELLALLDRIEELESEAGMHKAFAPNGCPVCYTKGYEDAEAELAAAKGGE